jgi:chemotaxis-related protein WspB
VEGVPVLVLTFQVGREQLALDLRRVREVVPRVRLEPVSGAPDWLAGVFVYRGGVVPVVDLHRLAGGGECPAHLSSRVILVPHGGDGRLVGLLATQVADIRDIALAEAPPASLTAEGRSDLGPVIADGAGVLRLLDPDRLLPDAARRHLLALPVGDRP